MTKNTLAPFNCTTMDGVPTMDAEPSIVCGVPGGPHARMKAVAGLMLVFFVLGVPAAFGGFLVYYRHNITADQTLRAVGEGDSALTNPDIDIRRRFRKLYEDYKPHAMFWKLVLLLRKLYLSCVVVLLENNPEAQVRILSSLPPRQDLSSWTHVSHYHCLLATCAATCTCLLKLSWRFRVLTARRAYHLPQSSWRTCFSSAWPPSWLCQLCRAASV